MNSEAHFFLLNCPPAAAATAGRAGPRVASPEEAPSSSSSSASAAALVVSVVAGVARVVIAVVHVEDLSDALDERIHSLGAAHLIEGLDTNYGVQLKHYISIWEKLSHLI